MEGPFWTNLSSGRAEKDATKQKCIHFQEVGQKRKMVIKIGFPLSHSDLQNFHWIFGLKSDQLLNSKSKL